MYTHVRGTVYAREHIHYKCKPECIRLYLILSVMYVAVCFLYVGALHVHKYICWMCRCDMAIYVYAYTGF